jgi:hypothetical protein
VAIGDKLLHAKRRFGELQIVTHSYRRTRLEGAGEYYVGFCGRHSERLLDEDVGPRVEALKRDGKVTLGWRGNVNHIRTDRRQHGADIEIRRDATPIAELLCHQWFDVATSDEPTVWYPANLVGVFVGNLSASDDCSS